MAPNLRPICGLDSSVVSSKFTETCFSESQNAAIDQGTVSAIKISMIALLLFSAWVRRRHYSIFPEVNVALEVDPDVQFKAIIDYGVRNTFRIIFNDTAAAALYKSYDDKCGPSLQNCSISNTDDACAQAANVCTDIIFGPVDSIDLDIYDVIQGKYPTFPPLTYDAYLQDSDIQKRIGAQVQFQNCSTTVIDNFVNSGDCRPLNCLIMSVVSAHQIPDARSFLSDLNKVVQSGIQVVLCNGGRGKSSHLPTARFMSHSRSLFTLTHRRDCQRNRRTESYR